MAKTIINGNGMSWQLPSRGVTMLGSMQRYDTYEELLRDMDRPEFAWVIDATGDPTVSFGGAFYSCKGNRIQRMFSEYTTAAPVDANTIKQAIADKANKFVNVFVRDEQEAVLEDEHKYYVMNKFTAILPEDASNGTTIQIVILPGGEASVLKVQNTDTINGIPGDMALNVAVLDITLVYDRETHTWYQF